MWMTVLCAVILVISILGLHGSVLAADPARVISRGSGDSKTIALTFDDGWHAGRCGEIYDTLVAFGVPATWFPNAVYMDADPGLWRRIARRFPIANHTTHHVSLPGRSKSKIRKEISSAERRIEKLTGRPMSKLFRPPYGALDKRVLREAGDLGYKQVVLWDVSGNDTSPRATDRGVARAALRGKAGSIVLMHCGPAVTARVLPLIIARYACRGFRFATVEGLLAGKAGVKAKTSCPAPELPVQGKRFRTDPAVSGTADPAEPDDLAGDWRLSEGLDNGVLVPVPADTILTLHFEPKKVSGLVGCDVFVARSSLGPGGGVGFDRLMRSHDSCQTPDSVAAGYLESLMAGVGQRIVEDGLELLDADGQVVLRFVPVDSTGLLGDWVATAMADTSGLLMPLGPDLALTANFGPTGVLTGSTSCASYRGGYSNSGASMQAGPLLTASVACADDPDGSAAAFLAALRSVAIWSLADATLKLSDPDARVVLELQRVAGG